MTQPGGKKLALIFSVAPVTAKTWGPAYRAIERLGRVSQVSVIFVRTSTATTKMKYRAD